MSRFCTLNPNSWNSQTVSQHFFQQFNCQLQDCRWVTIDIWSLTCFTILWVILIWEPLDPFDWHHLVRASSWRWRGLGASTSGGGRHIQLAWWSSLQGWPTLLDIVLRPSCIQWWRRFRSSHDRGALVTSQSRAQRDRREVRPLYRKRGFMF